MGQTLKVLINTAVEGYLAETVAHLTTLIVAAGMEIEPSAPLGLPVRTVAYGTTAERKSNTFRTIEIFVSLSPRFDVRTIYHGTLKSKFSKKVRRAVSDSPNRNKIGFPVADKTAVELGDHIWSNAPEAYQSATPPQAMFDALSALRVPPKAALDA